MKLPAIVDLWRETLAPEVALAAANSAATVPPTKWSDSPKALHVEWMKRAKRPDVYEVVELIRVSDFVKATAKQLLERFEVMTKWEPHPVATRWLVDVFARQTRAPTLEGGKCFRRVFNLLVDHLDKPGAQRLGSWIGTHRERIAATTYGAKFFDDGIARVLAKSKARLAAARALTAGELAALEKSGLLVEAAPPPREVTLDALMAAIYETPWDDAPRLVLADLLQQRNDPRGELIAIDLLPSPTPEQNKRRNALLREHGKAWFPEGLHKSVKRTAEYERGFLARGELMRTDRTPVELSTFRELACDPPGLPDLAHHVFRGVESWRRLVGPDRPESEYGKRWQAIAPCPRVTRLGFVAQLGSSPELVIEMLRPETFPALTELVIDLYTHLGWYDEAAPSCISEYSKLAMARFPQLTHVDVRPFARFDREGKTPELFLPLHITSSLVANYEYDYIIKARTRWLEWLGRYRVPIVVEEVMHVEETQRLLPDHEVRRRKERPFEPLPR